MDRLSAGAGLPGVAVVNEKLMWRGLVFTRSPESHRRYERWDSEAVGKYGKPLWSADRFPASEEWYARLLVSGHRITGKGPNMHLALDAALEEAKRVRSEMGRALPKER
jgi:hypothetical protein